MEYKQVNDYEVIYMIRENDEDARDLMLKKYMPVINKLSLKYCALAKKCGCEYEDLIQEGLIALNRAISSYNENGNVLFYTYANICIERHFITYCRTINGVRYTALNLNVGDENLLNMQDDKSLVEDITEDKLWGDKFIYYKNLFPFEQSCVFELKYNGFTYKEISSLLDIPVSTVDGRLCKIRRVLQEKEKKFS